MCNPFMLQHLLLLNAAYVIINDKTSKSANQITVLRTVSDEILLNMLKEYVTEHQTKDWFMNVIEILGRYIKGIGSDCKRSPSSNEIKLLLVAHIVSRFQLGTAEILMLDLLAESDTHIIYHLEVLAKTETNAIIASAKKDFSDYKHVDYTINRSFSYFSQYYAALVLEIIKFKIKQNKWNLDITDFCEDHFGNYITDFTSKFSFVLAKADQVKANVNFRLSNIFEQELSYDGVLESLAEHVNYTRTTIMVFYNIDDIIEAIECCKVSNPDLFTDEGIALFDILKCLNDFKNLRNIYKNLQNEFCIRKIFIECSLLTNYDYFFVKFYEVSDSFTLEEWKSDAVAYRELVTDTVGVVHKYRQTKCGNNDPYGRMSYL